MDLQIPGYKIIRPIADGGMASVHLAIQESLERQVALKLLKNIDNPLQSTRFRNEGRIIASLNHRNIITIHDIGVVGERHYISMEYLEDGDLEKRISKGMNIEAALELAEIIGGCLDFLHRRDIIHRDIKPANILFRKDGTPVLTDFGIAKHLENDIRLTLDSTALGSPYYLSPEQAECKPLDGRADIYGLGIMLYEMLTGVKPFQGDSPIETIMAHLTRPCPALPAELSRYQELIEQMVAKAPDDRYATAGEMVGIIRELRQHRPRGAAVATVAGAVRDLRNSRPWALVKVIAARIAARMTAKMHDYRDVGGRVTQGAVTVEVGQCRERLPMITTEPVRILFTSLVTAVRVAFRMLQEIRADHVRIRWALTGAVMLLLLTVTLKSFISEPLMMTAEEQTVSLPAGKATTQKVVLRLSDDLTLQRENDLFLARQALDDYRLTTPEMNNAYYYYQRILAEDPDDVEAITGVAQIADRYADLAQRELDQFHYGKAQVYRDRGLAVDPDNKRLLKLESTSAVSDVSKRTLDKLKSLFQ